MNVLPVMAKGFQGINLTVPLKETAFRGLNIDESAQRLGSVNTVKICPDGLKGYSTDGDGFLTSFKEEFGVSMKGLTVFMLVAARGTSCSHSLRARRGEKLFSQTAPKNALKTLRRN